MASYEDLHDEIHFRILDLLGQREWATLGAVSRSLQGVCMRITRLELSHITLTCESLNEMLERMRWLQELVLSDLGGCEGRLKFSHGSQLRKIQITRCDGFEALLIESPTPQLKTLIYPESVSEVAVPEAPRLAEMTISDEAGKVLKEHALYRYLPQVEVLLMAFGWRKKEYPADWTAETPDLANVKSLSVSIKAFKLSMPKQKAKVAGLARLFGATPALQKLTLNVHHLRQRHYPKPESIEELSMLSFNCLQELAIVGFHGNNTDFDILRRLRKASSVTLLRVVLDCRGQKPRSYWGESDMELLTERAQKILSPCEAVLKVIPPM